MPVLLIQDLAEDQIVTVGKDVGFHDHTFAYNALNGESPALNLGRNSSNNDTLSSVGW
jgi:hypothetical protein